MKNNSIQDDRADKMNNLEIKFDMPTSWRHGRGIVTQTGNMLAGLGCNRPLLLTDNYLISAGIIEPVTDSLKKEGITYSVCGDVDKEPTVKLFESIVDRLDLSSFDSIVAVGGGSVLDVAKGLSIIGSFGGSIRDYDGFDLVPGVPRIRVIAIPTTSGTGSEVSDGVVLIDEARDTKFLVLSKKICPAIAITDPEMTKTMPPHVTACSGMDALVHAIESFISKSSNKVTELFAEKAIKLIGKGLKPAYKNGNDMEARERMQVGATMAMTAAMNSYLGLCHAMAMPLCALYNIPHGQVCGLLLPHVLEYNSRAVQKKVDHIFHIMGYKHACHDIEGLLDEIGLSARISDFGYKEMHFQTIIKETLDSAQAPTNPREPTESELADIVNKIV